MAPMISDILENDSAPGQKMASLMTRLRCDAGDKSTLTSYQVATDTVTLLQSIVAEAK